MSTGTIRARGLHRARSAWAAHVAGVQIDLGAGLTRALLWLLATRALVWVAALAAMVTVRANSLVVGSLDPNGLVAPFTSSLANHLFAPAGRYDAVWYLGVAHGGYFSRQSSAFFPLYPILVHLGGLLVGSPLVAGMLISVGAMLGAGALMFELTRRELGEPAARTTLALLALFPTSLFFSAVYTESLFLLVSVAAVYAARQERWALAGVLGALASATRSAGVLVLVPLALMYLYGPREGGGAVRGLTSGGGLRRVALRCLPRYGLERSALWLALVPAGLAAYMGYLAVRHGAPLAPFQAEVYWGRHFAGPFGAVVAALTRLPDAVHRVLSGTQHPYGPGMPIGWEGYQLIDLPFLAFALGGLWLSWRRLSPALTAYALVMCCEAMSYPTAVDPLESVSRYLLVIFPLFMGWGSLLASRQWTRRIGFAVLGGGLVAFSALWGMWAWVA